MTSPQRTDAPSTRQRILETADRLFYGEGLRATGIDRIIGESGVAKRSFYRHFPTKQDLIVAFLEERRAAWIKWFRAEVDARLAKRGAGLEVIADVIESWFAQPDFRGCTFMNSVAEGAHEQAPIGRVVADHERDLAVYIEELAARLDLTPPRRVSEAAVLVIAGAVTRAQITGQHGDPTVSRLLLRGITSEFARKKAR